MPIAQLHREQRVHLFAFNLSLFSDGPKDTKLLLFLQVYFWLQAFFDATSHLPKGWIGTTGLTNGGFSNAERCYYLHRRQTSVLETPLVMRPRLRRWALTKGGKEIVWDAFPRKALSQFSPCLVLWLAEGSCSVVNTRALIASKGQTCHQTSPFAWVTLSFTFLSKWFDSSDVSSKSLQL